ncbi:hypothetical protein ABH935_002180 [Catenulispora sp. GAS73]|uniref:phthiocerol/phthiodiolone dimycocerosyl transferase family protein n=1 Tax=Catenulispora sp. GAS73 TaxID=3156269 RepID=UPI0035113F70
MSIHGTSRALSPAERWYWIIDQLSTLNVCARVRVEGAVSTDALLGGLRALQARQPLLRLAIATEPSGIDPRFVPTNEPIPLREVTVTRLEEERWAREIDTHEFAESVDWRTGPLARAVVIRQPEGINDLILSVPHYISDGTTALALLRQCVLLAAEPGTAEAADAADASETPIPVPVEDLFPERHRTTAGALPDREAADPTADESAEAGRLEPEIFVPFDQRRTRLLHRCLPADALADLTAACKREGVTLHGVLAAALASAVARDAEAAPGSHFAVGSPVSFRDELQRPVSEDEVGCFVSAVHSVVAYQPDDLWSMARFVNRDLTERRERGDQYPVFTLLATQGPAGIVDSEPLVRYIEEHGSFNFFISNIGRFDFPAEVGGWRLSGAQFVGGISVVGYLASSVATSHGQLSWNFTHIADAVSRERAERIADDSVKTVLTAAVAGS